MREEIKIPRKRILRKQNNIGKITRIERNRRINMAITRKFKDTVQKRAAGDPEFRHALLIEAINELLAGDYNIAKSILRNYINATITFPVLAQELNKSSKSIHRMLGPNGNPRMDSIVGILKVLQTKESIKLRTNMM
jgi:DNA-binding phage protein